VIRSGTMGNRVGDLICITRSLQALSSVANLTPEAGKSHFVSSNV
jgi:hypothetical protein